MSGTDLRTMPADTEEVPVRVERAAIVLPRHAASGNGEEDIHEARRSSATDATSPKRGTHPIVNTLQLTALRASTVQAVSGAVLPTLASLVSPLSEDDFRAHYWTCRPLHIKGHHERFRDLFGWEALHRILNHIKLPSPSVKIYSNGRPIQPGTLRTVLEHVRDGATLIVEEAEWLDPQLGQFLDNLSTDIFAGTRFNIYLSAAGKPGYKRHYDTQDAIILQIAGEKRWRIFPPTTVSPLYVQKHHDEVPPSDDALILDCVLKPGESLYLPKGFWHEAIATKDRSLHLTLAIAVPTGIDFLKWLVDELRADEVVRQVLPIIVNNGDGADVEDALPPYIRLLKEHLAGVLSNTTLDADFRMYRAAQYRRRVGISDLLRLNDEEILDRVRLGQSYEMVAQPCFVRRYEKTGEVGIVVSAKSVIFPKTVERVLRVIIKTRHFEKVDLLSAGSGLTPVQIDRCLYHLLREDIIRLKEG